jgi:hypothetical protein
MAGDGGVVEASRSVRRRGPGAFEGCRPFAVVVSSGTAVVPSHRLEVDGSAGGGSREEMPEGADLGLPIAPLGTRCFSIHCRCRSTLERIKNRSEPPLLKRPWIRHPVAPQRRAGWGGGCCCRATEQLGTMPRSCRRRRMVSSRWALLSLLDNIIIIDSLSRQSRKHR